MALRKSERELLSKRAEKRRLDNTIQRMVSGSRKDSGRKDNDVFDEYDDPSSKRTRRSKDKYGYLCLTQDGLILVPDKM